MRKFNVRIPYIIALEISLKIVDNISRSIALEATYEIFKEKTEKNYRKIKSGLKEIVTIIQVINQQLFEEIFKQFSKDFVEAMTKEFTEAVYGWVNLINTIKKWVLQKELSRKFSMVARALQIFCITCSFVKILQS